MKSDFLIAITQLSAEKNLPKEVVLGAVEAALVSAYRKDNFSPNQNVTVKINPNTGSVAVWAGKTVVEKPEDPRAEMTLKEAKIINPDAKLEDEVVVEATPPNAGRIAAQTAKQVILQRLHEAEHSAIYEEYANKEGDILTGVVHRVEPKQILVDLGRSEAVMPLGEQVPSERYRVGQRLRIFLVEVMRTPKGPRVVVSRSHPNLLRRLFELEVPEVFNGLVEIKAIAREAGYRSKISVAAKQEGVDPVGCCVGLRGIRIQNVVNELGGEKIDVVSWHEDAKANIADALSPAQVLRVELNPETEMAVVVVPDRQLSLAIGKEGQNVRLAAKLTGWRIDIRSASQAEEERQATLTPAARAKPAAKKTTEAEPVASVTEPAPEPEPAEEVVPVAAETLVSEEALAVADDLELERLLQEEGATTADEAEAEEEGELITADLLSPISFDSDMDSGAPVVRFSEDIFPNLPGRTGRGDRSRGRNRGRATVKGKGKGKGASSAAPNTTGNTTKPTENQASG